MPVPIKVTSLNLVAQYIEPTVAGTEGQPRSTVQEVCHANHSYINKATELLEGIKAKDVKHVSHIV